MSTGGRRVRRFLVALLCALAVLPLTARPASAHPLGNFTVSHYNGLRLFPDRVESTAVVDYAELPTVQERTRADADGDGAVTPVELDAHRAGECARLASAQRLRVDGQDVTWQVTGSALAEAQGTGGLRTSRLRCTLTAPADLSRPATVEFGDPFLADRIGWREITATSDGVTLADPPVGASSISDELRSYPDDLLSNPLDQRSVQLRTTPGGGTPGGGTAGAGTADAGTVAGAAPPAAPDEPAGFPGLAVVSALEGTFTRLVGSDRLTPTLTALAIGLALVVGAAHAATPGHGKAIMAAYLAGRGGRRRDALLVGVTVTTTHTMGVLVVGLLVSVSSSLAGETVLGWLGTASGVLVALIGLGLLRTAWRHRRTASTGHEHTDDHPHGHPHPHEHTHDHPDVHPHPHGHDHAHCHAHGATDGPRSRRGLVGLGVAGGLVPSPSALVVLLGAVGLGRPALGIVLVAAYGLGMAATLTAVGLVLVRLAGRVEQVAAGGRGRLARAARLTPVLTSTSVVALGAGMAVRGLTGAI